jgi:hypothetical protein
MYDGMKVASFKPTVDAAATASQIKKSLGAGAKDLKSSPEQEKIKEQLALSMAAKESADRAAKRAESDAVFARNPRSKQRYLSMAERAKGESNLQAAKIAELKKQLTPTGAQATQAMSAEKAQEARAEAAATDPRRLDNSPAESKPVQESAETLLAQLNTKLDELIMINRKVADLNDSQLRVQKSMGNDLYT